MDLDDPQKRQNEPSWKCQSINDENNNLKHLLCSSCEGKSRVGKEENETMIIIPDISSDDEYCCSSCSSSMNDTELVSIDIQRLWHHITHLIKCVYRETNREFIGNHSSDELCQVKEYVQILTQLNSESLFHKMESIVLEYVDEIRSQVLKRFETCLKTTHDIQLFISFLLDEYHLFVQAAHNVSTILSSLEEHYLKSFHVTWLLYNKYLYEKFVYMDKDIHDSLSIMIDLLQPSNDDDLKDYSPAEYTQLLNRFLAFDEEMSEIACLYKDCQRKMNAISKDRTQMGIIVQSKKKKSSKKTEKILCEDDNRNSSTTTAVDIPSSKNFLLVPSIVLQGSDGSSVESGVDGKDLSSISSVDEYLLDNQICSSNDTKDELNCFIPNDQDLHHPVSHEILVDDSPVKSSPCEVVESLTTNTTMPENKEDKSQTIIDAVVTPECQSISNVMPTKKCKSIKSSSNRRKESSTSIPIKSSSLPKTSFASDLFVPPKPRSSAGSKFQPDFRPLTFPLLTNNDNSSCSPFLSAKIQSVSFTAGTFGSITTNESSSQPNNSTRLNVNLRRKPGPSMIDHNDLDQLLCQATSASEISAIFSSCAPLSSKQSVELFPQKCSFNENDSDYCCRCHSFHDDDSLTNNDSLPLCVNCMSLPNTAMITCGFNQRDVEMKERLKIKLTKRAVQNIPEQSKPTATGHKLKMKPSDNNIDDLVRFIDGDETISDEHQTTTTKESTSKKNKKKKDKQIKSNLSNEETKTTSTNQKDQNALNVTQQTTPLPLNNPVAQSTQLLSKRKQKAKMKLEQNEKQVEETIVPIVTTTTRSSTPSAPSEKANSIRSNLDSPVESLSPSEEEINWITIARKQNKHKPTPSIVPSLLKTSVASSHQTKQKQQDKSTKIHSKKITINNPSTVVQQNVITQTGNLETKISNNVQQKNITAIPIRVQNLTKTNPLPQQQKTQPPSVWTSNTTSHEHDQVKPTSTLLATTPAFVPSSTLSSLLMAHETKNVSSSISVKDSSSSNPWNPNVYLLPSETTIVPFVTPGPVRRPPSSFSPVSTTINPPASRCIQRPSSEPRTSPSRFYSPLANTVDTSTSIWNDTSINNSNQSLWQYSQDSSLTTFDDYPLYDPFKSGTVLNIPTSTLLCSTFEEHYDNLSIRPSNSIDRLNTLDEKNEDSQKLGFDNDLLDAWNQLQFTNDQAFLRQS